MYTSVYIIASLECLFALFLLYREGYINTLRRLSVCSVIILTAMMLRIYVFNYESLDYREFLTHWVTFFRDHGGILALSQSVGNYNVPYLYFLAIFSYFDARDLYLIKLLSTFFDIVLAYAVMKLVKKATDDPDRSLLGFFVTLFLPTVFLNGAYWAQCDVIYVSLMLLGIYLALDDRPVLSMVCAALSFGFKLQAVFILPVYAVLWMMGKFKFKHFFIFPLAYVILVLPAVIVGKPFIETLMLYIDQADTVGSALSYSAPSIFASDTFVRLFPSEAAATSFGIIAAFVFMFAVLGLCFFSRRELNSRALVSASLLLSAGIPFFLPHMHERYFFGADALSLVLAFVDPLYAVAALLMQFASMFAYRFFLGMTYVVSLRKCALAVALVIALALCSLCKQLFPSKNESKKNLS